MDEIKRLYEDTDLTIEEIAYKTGYSVHAVWSITTAYPKEYRNARKKRNYSKSKLGDKNPQFGMTGSKNDKYIGEVSDGKGYIMVMKPDWYTGRKGSKHVFKHQVVMCESLGITEIPKGFCVHHVDEDKTNNNLINLALMTTSAHMRLHQLEGATTRAKARRVQVDSKRDGEVTLGASRDIV
jgi:hypothetical protein